MRKKLVLFLTGAMCLTMLAGCGQKGGSGSAENTDKEAGKSEDKEVLSMMLNGSASDAYVEGYQKIIDEFNKTNEFGVTIEPEFVSNSDYKTKLTTMMASDSAPDIIFTWELGYLENFVNGDKIVNLQEYLDADQEWKESFNSGTLEQETYNGDVYGIPTAQCMAVMYYNKAIFEENGLAVPTTYDEYRLSLIHISDKYKTNLRNHAVSGRPAAAQYINVHALQKGVHVPPCCIFGLNSMSTARCSSCIRKQIS